MRHDISFLNGGESCVPSEAVKQYLRVRVKQEAESIYWALIVYFEFPSPMGSPFPSKRKKAHLFSQLLSIKQF